MKTPNEARACWCPPVTKREQLARVLSESRSPEYWHYAPDDIGWQQECYRNVDAILAELREPDERASKAGREAMKEFGLYPSRRAFKAGLQAMIDAIE